MHLLRRPEVHIVTDFRTGADQGHIPDKDIDQLRELIQFELPDNIPRAGNPRIVAADGDQAALIGAHPHRPELEDPEIFVVKTDPDLSIEHRPLGIQLDPNSQNQEQWAQNEEPESARNDVKYTLHRLEMMST